MVLPFILPFRDLKLSRVNNKYGVAFNISDNPQGVISGKDAQEVIKSIDHRANSGAGRLVRNVDGCWSTYWNRLATSLVGYGRVDFVCGVATREKLKDALKNEISRNNSAIE